jgi:hypothetical protein
VNASAGLHAPANSVERSCALLAHTLSQGRRTGARLVTGERRGFGLDARRAVVEVPFPALAAGWTQRTVTCGIALQSAPSKDAVANLVLDALTPRQLTALTVVEAVIARNWLQSRWPGLIPECERHLDGLDQYPTDVDTTTMVDAALELARSGQHLFWHPLLGRLNAAGRERGWIAASLLRMRTRLPWGDKQATNKIGFSVPVAGDGGVRNPNLPPPSRPEDEEAEIRNDRRIGVPYPEWNAWTQSFLPNHVAVFERAHHRKAQAPQPVSPAVQRWFEQRTHRVMRNGLDDGCDVDIDRYIDHYVDVRTGHASEPRLFRDLVPGVRDVTTALLLDGSSSLGVHQGRIFRLELACADALSQAMRRSKEPHGVFTFNGNTRHRVEVRCLKDFKDTHHVVPGDLGLLTGGYTRLGAPIRHLTARLVREPAARRLLIVIGDGLMSDEGYEGRYAWADVAHAVEEAGEAGVSIYYIGVGPVRIDPLPEVFGWRRSARITRVEQLPAVLANVHRELVAA